MPRGSEAAAFYQTAAILIGLAELGLLLGVFLAQDTLAQHRMVSTNLFALAYYKAATSLLIALQLLIVALFLTRFRLAARVWTGVGLLFLCCALVGWTITVSCSPDTDGTNHSLGAGIFVGGTAAYFAITLTLTYKFDPVGSRRYDLMAYGVMLAAGAFTLVYIVLYFSSPDWAWLFENIAFVLTAAGYLIFFWFHPFDPSDTVAAGRPPVQCRPLLPAHGAQMVPDVDAFY